MNYKKGFTLIELLVVIAIIGILASVVLASLGSARNKGADAAIKSGVAGMRAQAEIWYDDHSQTYGTFTVAQCPIAVPPTPLVNIFEDSTMLLGLKSIGANAGGMTKTQCVAGLTTGVPSYAIAAQLKTGGVAADTIPDSYCVDSAGNSKVYTYATSETIANAITGGLCK
jgi:prepilin-type N-terminal cleavage/methylation domain-containing protein